MTVKKFDEISVKEMYPKLLERNEMKPFFPDKYPKGRQCQKEYFWDIANTIFPEEVSRLIINANAQRFQEVEDDDGNQRIEVSDKWLQLLNAQQFRSQKKGKFIHLLKKGS